MTRLRSIEQLPHRWQRRLAAIFYYPLCMLVLAVMFGILCVVAAVAALADAARVWGEDAAQLKEEFLCSTHRIAKRVWRK